MLEPMKIAMDANANANLYQGAPHDGFSERTEKRGRFAHAMQEPNVAAVTGAVTTAAAAMTGGAAVGGAGGGALPIVGTIAGIVGVISTVIHSAPSMPDAKPSDIYMVAERLGFPALAFLVMGWLLWWMQETHNKERRENATERGLMLAQMERIQADNVDVLGKLTNRLTRLEHAVSTHNRITERGDRDDS